MSAYPLTLDEGPVAPSGSSQPFTYKADDSAVIASLEPHGHTRTHLAATLDPFLAPPEATSPLACSARPAQIPRTSCTYNIASLGFLTLVALDAFGPRVLVSGAWWLVLFMVWLTPWPNRAFDTRAPARFSWEALHQLTVLAVFGWLYARACVSIAGALYSWRFTDPDGPLRLLTFPLQTALLGLAIAALLARPLHRALGARAVAAAFVIAAPTIIYTCIDTLSDVTRWLDRPVANAIHTFDAVFPLLLTMQRCARLERRANRTVTQQRTQRTFLARLGPLFDRCPRWFANSAVAPLLLITVAATILRFWVDALPAQQPALSALVALALPVCTVLVTAAVIHELRKRRVTARTGPLAGKLLFPLRAVVSAVLLAPLWAWTLMMDAPLAEYYASNAFAALPGPAWTLDYDGSTRTLRLSGEYQHGVANAFSTKLDELPEVALIELEGPGGLSHEGFAIAEAIETRNLATHATDDCESACTIAFMAGRERTLASEARLGFHSGWSPVALYDDDDTDYSAHLRRRGVARDFIRRADDVPATDMWYPTNDELKAAGVITAVR